VVPRFRPSSTLRSDAFFSSAAISSGVKNSRPATLAGRSNGVIVRFEYVPWRSGSPQGVRGVVHRFCGPPADCAAREAPKSEPISVAAAMTTAAAKNFL
jgi:hypothetical protein